MHDSRRSNRGPWRPTSRDAIVVSAETIAFLGQVVLCEGKGNLTKSGDDYRRYMQQVPRVNFDGPPALGTAQERQPPVG